MLNVLLSFLTLNHRRSKLETCHFARYQFSFEVFVHFLVYKSNSKCSSCLSCVRNIPFSHQQQPNSHEKLKLNTKHTYTQEQNPSGQSREWESRKKRGLHLLSWTLMACIEQRTKAQRKERKKISSEKYKTHAQDIHMDVCTVHTQSCARSFARSYTHTHTCKQYKYVYRNSDGSVTVYEPHHKASQASACYAKMKRMKQQAGWQAAWRTHCTSKRIFRLCWSNQLLFTATQSRTCLHSKRLQKFEKHWSLALNFHSNRIYTNLIIYKYSWSSN